MEGKFFWRFKLNKLILYVLFKLILFVSLIYIKTKTLKICKFLKNFNHIIFSIMEPNVRKSLSLAFSFHFPSTFRVPNGALRFWNGCSHVGTLCLHTFCL